MARIWSDRVGKNQTMLHVQSGLDPTGRYPIEEKFRGLDSVIALTTTPIRMGINSVWDMQTRIG